MKINWLIPLVGVVVIAGGLVSATTYLKLERKIRDDEAFTVLLDRVYQNQKVSAALRSIHDGGVDGAAQSLDALLCANILHLNSDLDSADARSRTCVEDAFKRIALLRPKNGTGTPGGSVQQCSEDQAAAERILALALAGDHSRQAQ